MLDFQHQLTIIWKSTTARWCQVLEVLNQSADLASKGLAAILLKIPGWRFKLETFRIHLDPLDLWSKISSAISDFWICIWVEMTLVVTLLPIFFWLEKAWTNGNTEMVFFGCPILLCKEDWGGSCCLAALTKKSTCDPFNGMYILYSCQGRFDMLYLKKHLHTPFFFEGSLCNVGMWVRKRDKLKRTTKCSNSQRPRQTTASPWEVEEILSTSPVCSHHQGCVLSL